ncbi:DUF3293 domain-containing protein [Pseudoxanthomonas daejeonensis]|uniref:DUF3293 domain-containing protein n=1 Tax=Pseudoxanthomonas daejeonensis TaxID=266062 RepID=A0ABQ6Z5A0_9GAMM|nr:DUF3293 domain-containing protein [Pseudoxanthomonas daejeonensis]KAF1693230.1 hypothetical protein CSC65_12355 [Pseudoxanthomonas daejeonensis]UNK57543.1 DUF3293 domain-containing protein [Pseudoxanthomonas daejeonensis]
MAENSIPGAAPATDTLLHAYLAARYRVRLDDGHWLAVAIGRHIPAELVQALSPGSASRLTLITAWNPQSLVRSASANAAADAALRAELDALGRPTLRAAAADADGGWEERGWLVEGLDAATADVLARRYDQAGLLHWDAREPVRLRMYRARPMPGGTLGDIRWVDWMAPESP